VATAATVGLFWALVRGFGFFKVGGTWTEFAKPRGKGNTPTGPFSALQPQKNIPDIEGEGEEGHEAPRGG